MLSVDPNQAEKEKGSRKRRRADKDERPAKPAVACCELTHDPKGNTVFLCLYPACGKSYASRDAVRKHCRIRHVQWLCSLERVSTHQAD